MMKFSFITLFIKEELLNEMSTIFHWEFDRLSISLSPKKMSETNKFSASTHIIIDF